MAFDYQLLNGLPSPFYRVAVKALIFDDQKRMLVGQLDNPGYWEIPGGGLEHEESIEDCVHREIFEELGVKIKSVGKVKFIYRGKNEKGYWALRLVVPVELASHEFKPKDLAFAKFVTREEFLNTDFSGDELPIKDCVDLIWPSDRRQ